MESLIFSSRHNNCRKEPENINYKSIPDEFATKKKKQER